MTAPQFQTKRDTVWCVFNGTALINIYSDEWEARFYVSSHPDMKVYMEEWDVE